MANPEFRDAVQHITNELWGLRSALSFDNISRIGKCYVSLDEDIKIAFIDRCAKDAVLKPQTVNVCPVK
jgi:hypothetical protein